MRASGWSQGWHLPHLDAHPDAEIAAIVDPTFETAHWQGQGKGNHWSGGDFLNVDELGEKYGCPTFADVDDMVASGLEVDGVLVASNHATHAEMRESSEHLRLDVESNVAQLFLEFLLYCTMLVQCFDKWKYHHLLFVF